MEDNTNHTVTSAPEEPPITCGNEEVEGISIEDCISQMRVEMNDKQKQKKPIHSLASFDGSCRSKIAKYLSTGAFEELEVNSFNVEQYLYIAKELGHSDLKRYCEGELLKQLSPEVCLDMLQIANGYDLQRLKLKSEEMIENNFESIYPTQDFQFLGKNEVLTLIKKSKIQSHPHVMNAVEHWYEYEREFRLDGYNEMCSLLKTNEKPTTPEKECSKCHRYIGMFTHDEIEKLPKVLVMNFDTFEMFSLHIRKLGDIGSNLAVCCQQNGEEDAPYVYVAGGNGKTSNRVFKFDVVMSKWKELNCLKEGRHGYCLVCVQNTLYLLGGISISKEQNVSEIEERKTGKQWKEIGKLIHAVRSPAYVVHDDNIYLFGGILDNGEYSSAIQCFNVKSRESKVVSMFPSPVSGGKAITLNNRIYILTYQGSLYIFDPLSNQCTEGATHAHALSEFAMITDGVNIFTAGGICGDSECIQDIYKYTVTLNQWERIDKVLPHPMKIHGYCEMFIQSDCAFVPFID